MKHPRVKDILIAYKFGGIAKVAGYLTDPDLKIEEGTWTFKMKTLLESKKIGSMEAEIASLLFIFNLTNENGTEDTIGRCDTGE